VNWGLFLRALGLQALAVGLLFAILLALPLDGDFFFRDYGFLTGPIAWALCSLLTATVLSLPRGVALFAALAGGLAGLLLGLLASHTAGLLVALLIFGVSAGGYEAQRDAARGSRRERVG
jgi:hypothetical protein